jgi:hypothetical protein
MEEEDLAQTLHLARRYYFHNTGGCLYPQYFSQKGDGDSSDITIVSSEFLSAPLSWSHHYGN